MGVSLLSWNIIIYHVKSVLNKYRHGYITLTLHLTTYCQAKCRSCARTNEHTGEKEDWLPLVHMDLDLFENRLKEIYQKDWTHTILWGVR